MSEGFLGLRKKYWEVISIIVPIVAGIIIPLLNPNPASRWYIIEGCIFIVIIVLVIIYYENKSEEYKNTIKELEECQPSELVFPALSESKDPSKIESVTEKPVEKKEPVEIVVKPRSIVIAETIGTEKTKEVNLGMCPANTLVEGIIKEASRQKFNYELVDEDNYILYAKGKRYRVLRSGHDEPIYRVAYIMDDDRFATLYLILSIRGKINDREINGEITFSTYPLDFCIYDLEGVGFN